MNKCSKYPSPLLLLDANGWLAVLDEDHKITDATDLRGG